ncbi:MAG: hypothetical protein WC356_05490 [Candidatus Micrarchaeia archaeon]|jgi:hypothetical protein
MKLIELWNKKMDIWDIGLTKLAVFFGTLFIASLIPQILSLNWYIYLIAALVLAIRPMYKFFKK